MRGLAETLAAPALLLGLLGAAFFVFRRVRSDYTTHGKLSRSVAWLQVGYFFAYALSSYVFLDSRLSHVKIRGALLVLAGILLLIGTILVAVAMPFLGGQSFGGQVGRLHTSGIYRYSRNPQLVGGFLFIVGYAMLWPSWQGAAWAAMWLVIAHIMVQGEEAHLQRTFGDQYQKYRADTPRYLGIVKRPRG